MSVASKVVPSVRASSVCWSLQCLISALIQRWRWWTLFFFFFKAHLFSRVVGREGRCKQITLACARSASATLGLPLLMACVASLPTLLSSRLLCREPSEASPEWYALPRSKPPRFRYLGSPQRHRLGWACVLCPSQVRAAQTRKTRHILVFQ